MVEEDLRAVSLGHVYMFQDLEGMDVPQKVVESVWQGELELHWTKGGGGLGPKEVTTRIFFRES